MDYTINICSLAARIEENIKQNVDYSELEKTVGYSYEHIRAFFKQVTGTSLSRYIMGRRIANIAFELRHSEKSITELAFEYDFIDVGTVTRAFHRYIRMSPSEFRRSGFLCGRRIICAGVYAPVILNHDNPVFTLQHIMEVNEMSEMRKTVDSCILYGVPKIYFNRSVDGEEQNSPFPMCLQAVLNYLGQNLSYAEIMAYSGAAFRQRWDSNGWNIAANDIRFTYGHHLQAFELAFQGVGRKVIISENNEQKKSINKDDATALIKSELDCGRPVIALGVVGPPEACIITGYRNNGETLLGWSLFQDFWGGCEIDESGYFIKDNWWETTETIMSVGEEIGNSTSVKEVLENALMLMTTDEMPTYGGNDIFYGGQLAYETWAQALETVEFDVDGANMGQKDQEKMLGEGRYYAAVYLELLAARYPELTKEFNECARFLKLAAGCAQSMRELREKYGLEMKTRQEIAELIREAAQYEATAFVVLAEIIKQFSGK